MSALALERVNYVYEEMARKLLESVTIEFEGDKFYVILGGSGAGKSTLLGPLAELNVPTNGKILCNGKDISEEGFPKHRKRNMSLAFQNYNLIDYLTPLENFRLVNHRADAGMLEKMGPEKEEINHNTMKLSGGQQQRVVIGRALVSDAPVILANEPTGNLDEDTASDIIDIPKTAARDRGKCVIVVMHSKRVTKAADAVLRLRSRKLVAWQRDLRMALSTVRPRNPPASSVLAPLCRTTSWGTSPM